MFYNIYVCVCISVQDEYMVRTNSLTERVKLWSQFEGPVDQHTVKIDFLKHVHRVAPPFCIKRKLPPRKTVSVSLNLYTEICI